MGECSCYYWHIRHSRRYSKKDLHFESRRKMRSYKSRELYQTAVICHNIVCFFHGSTTSTTMTTIHFIWYISPFSQCYLYTSMTMQGLDLLDLHGYADLTATAIRHLCHRWRPTRSCSCYGYFFLDIWYGGRMSWVYQAAVSLIDSSFAQNCLPQGLNFCFQLGLMWYWKILPLLSTRFRKTLRGAQCMTHVWQDTQRQACHQL